MNAEMASVKKREGVAVLEFVGLGRGFFGARELSPGFFPPFAVVNPNIDVLPSGAGLRIPASSVIKKMPSIPAGVAVSHGPSVKRGIRSAYLRF